MEDNVGLRTSHGSKRQNTGQPVVIEVQPADELKKVNPDDIDARIEEGKKIGRPFKKGNKAAAGRRPKLARLGLECDVKDPAYKACLRMAETYRRRRVSEFKKTHGFLSVGAMSLLATSALQLAASRYMMDKAFKDGNMGQIKLASGIANDARQNELAAWELASREAGAKARSAAKEVPWLARLRVSTPDTELSPFSAEPLDTEQEDGQAADVVKEGQKHGKTV